MQNIKIHGIKDSYSIAFKGRNVFNQISDLFNTNSEVIKMAWNEESEDKNDKDDFEDEPDSDWDDTEKDDDEKDDNEDFEADTDSDW